MRDTVVVGVCATGRVAMDCLISAGREREVAGYLDGSRDGAPRDEAYDGVPVMGSIADIDELRNKAGIRRAVVGVGEIRLRRDLCAILRKADIELVNAIHATAAIARSASLGVNVIAAPNATVAVGAHIGDGVLLNTACSVDHDCAIGDFAHICPGTVLAGTVTVGAGAWVGLGSRVVQGLTIGVEAFLGAGSVVVKEIPPGVLAYGVPAKVIRRLEDDERGRIIS